MASLVDRLTMRFVDSRERRAAVRDREPRFIESALFIASIEVALAAGDGPGQARVHLTEALARFPASTAILYLTGNYHQLVENYSEALGIYDRMLAVQPANNPARLGRLMCLSKLARAQEAIEEATRLLELGDDNRADAYYWRAHNHRALGQLAEARRDISAAKESSTTPDVLSLAGIIEYEQRDLDPAEADLTAATSAAGEDCTARWYLALIHRQRKHWLISGHTFEDAMGASAIARRAARRGSVPCKCAPISIRSIERTPSRASKPRSRAIHGNSTSPRSSQPTMTRPEAMSHRQGH